MIRRVFLVTKMGSVHKTFSMNFFLLFLSGLFFQSLLSLKSRKFVKTITGEVTGAQETSSVMTSSSILDIAFPFKSLDANEKITARDIFERLFYAASLVFCGALTIFICSGIICALLAGFYYGFKFLYKKFKNRNIAGDTFEEENEEGIIDPKSLITNESDNV